MLLVRIKCLEQPLARCQSCLSGASSALPPRGVCVRFCMRGTRCAGEGGGASAGAVSTPAFLTVCGISAPVTESS